MTAAETTRRLDPVTDGRFGTERDRLNRERRAKYLYGKEDWENLRKEFTMKELRELGIGVY